MATQFHPPLSSLLPYKPLYEETGVAITFNGDTNFATHKSNGDNGQEDFTRNNIGPAT